ncbi:acetate--CoA ligase family protein [Streptomyces sp. WI04-05B]|uniref:acetate--CoA ligase family protein n=1 Tax=Streptomyces TaxID=1883 RepID=UPI0029A32015|nr:MULTISPECIES: acetate--CoA ligase family protein [unclassified Streptomyces]MDX2548149.1 acetate--CoA ligase family protein [Streptomyces sp. WI04-05B]MDX2583175.1 acetate--CoA ligase family protein [Streptomyces sp. WI04-05A]MDX3748493.1 acetate--CoA ligase family protein [Streptomyces sp. AK08-02]
MTALEALFAPRAIAVLGASATPGKLGAAMADSLASFPGPVMKVNSGRPDPDRGFFPTVGEAAAAHGTTPDLVVSCIPAAVTADALREAAAVGARAALVCAGGFAEAGGDGPLHQKALTEVVRDTGIRVLGPNTSGFLVPHRRLTASFVPGAPDLEPGPVAVVAASGGVNHALAFALAEAGVGLRLGVGLGNSLDVTQGDVLDHLAEDDGVRAVALHVETAAEGRRLTEAVRRLTDRVPVVALVVGRSDIGDFARSHTGALATSWRVTRTALRQAGAVLVDDERDLVDAVTALSRVRLPAHPRAGVGLVTAQAGPGLLLTDDLRSHDIQVPPLVERTVKELRELLPALTYLNNPVDTGRPSPTITRIVERVSEDPRIDVTAVYGLLEPTTVDLPAALTAARTATPLVAVVGGPVEQVRRTRRELGEAGIPCAATPAAGSTMVRALVEDAAARTRPEAVRTASDAPALPPPGPVDEHTAKGVLADLGINTPVRRVCAGPAAAHAALDELGGSVVVKILDAEILHKTEVGGVQVGIRTHAELDEALARMPASPALLVEQMAPAGPELIVGVRRDPVFGPVLALGAGGTAAEILGDVSLRLAPLSENEAHAMLDELAIRRLFLGARGAAPVDRARLTHVLLALASLAADDAVAECEINPLRVLPDGDLVALDAVLLLRDPRDQGGSDDA